MKKGEIIKYSLINAVGITLYIIFIVLFVFIMNGSGIGGNNSVLVPIFMLMLFVFSAAFTGSLMLGRPVVWYLDGKKREAVSLFIHTMGILFAIIVLVFLGIVLSVV